MIQSLSTYKKQVACLLVSIFYLQLLAPLYAAIHTTPAAYQAAVYYPHISPANNRNRQFEDWRKEKAVYSNPSITSSSIGAVKKISAVAPEKLSIGGPSSPEATSFKAVGSSNLVNLFTGDFSYSIPLLDVGGYPVNLFYNGGIGMEQEASWVGLGWNINPGSVSRNMRGVPDDFDGTDTLTQTQNVKPNRTWGGEVGVDGELLGIKEPKLGLSVGFSYNNYLGPALETGATVSVSLPIQENIKAEKYAAPNIGISLGAKLSSRSGLTLSPSLNASLAPTDGMVSTGIGLSTSYNSRSGIASLNLHAEQTKYVEQSRTIGDDYRSTKSSTSISLGSSTISFAKPSYMPTMRMSMQNNYTSGQVEFGGGAFGFRGSATLNGYYSISKVPVESQVVKKPLVGFMYSEKARTNTDAVMDFNRVNDAEVTPNTPIISAPMYTYDIFSIQGEGTGGTIRAYRGDLGFMRDNVTTSKDGNLAIGADIAPPGHYGINVNTINAPTRVGGWEDNNNTLRQAMTFQPKSAGSSFENVYFRNPGEATVTSEDALNRIGRDSLVRFALSGSAADPRIETKLELFGKKTITQSGTRSILGNASLPTREKRTQVTTMLTAEDAAKVGLEKTIRNYRTGNSLFDATDNHILYDSFPRVSEYRKKNHISEIDVLEQNGMRYVYGIPVYSVEQTDFTFSVGNPADADNLVNFDPKDVTVGSDYMDNSSKIDGYLEKKETPAYASSFLITGLLSPDYVDVTGDGITEDDLGGAVKFNYTKSTDNHKWRTPRNNNAGKEQTAHFNEGKRSEKRDNKATISYGEREAWYLNSIESKSMVAIFKTGVRNDAKGVTDSLNSKIYTSENANKKLERIDLYTKADIKANGINGAKAIKSVLFEYNYTLCKKTPDNISADSGKLTLTAISFAYNGQPRSNKERYVFNYGNITAKKDNPDYGYNASDRWGTYKPAKDSSNNALNPGGLNNIDYPYSLADNNAVVTNAKALNDQFAGAWSLKKILLPSGGQMEIQYEADDYAYVQNRRACNMFPIYGLGTTTAATTNNGLYNYGGTDNLYVYIKLPQALQNTDPVKRKAEIYAKYLATLQQLAFRLQINMPKGVEPLTSYATAWDDWGLCSNSPGNDIIYIKMADLDGRSPLAKSSTSFLIENLTGQAFPGYDAAEVNTLPEFFDLMGSMLTSISNAFTNAENQVRDAGSGRTIILSKSFVRLANPGLIKYGGGERVKRVLVRDNWDKMTGQYVSTYGQDYEYTTTEKINGQETTISSGVASYEPGIGSEENPFREILNFSNKLPLASAQYGAIEMPMLEAFYPSPVVGYSKVTVRSIHRKGTHGDSTLRSAIGKQVTEFYTAKDYPSFTSYTPMNTMDYKKDPFFSFFNKEVINRRIISQGFLVENNDMHGKIKYQAAYSESDEKTPISASYHTYKNTGQNGLNDKVDYVYNKESGAVHAGNMGVDMELMTDVREFSIESRGKNVMGQVDIFFFAFITIPVPTVYPTKSYIENKYRAVTCTKLINYHAIEDSVIVMDKGSVVSTKTIAYDSETGSSLVTKTANEFNDPVYNTSYPAYWAYSGMGLAYENIDRIFTGANFNSGILNIPGLTFYNITTIFESGDELYITNDGNASSTCIPTSASVTKLWVYDQNKNTSALTPILKSLVFIDKDGKPYTKTNVSFRILRSGRRNLLGSSVATFTTMAAPIVNGVLSIDANSKAVAASAMEYREKWQTDNDNINRYTSTYNSQTCVETLAFDCDGTLEKNINPYVKGLIGNYKTNRSTVFYGSRAETSTSPNSTAIRKNGYLSGFTSYWNFNPLNSLVPDVTNTKWVWNSELTKINSKGQEVETRDALNRYTAAQYGFERNLPLAMVQNASYGEGFAEGFEDDGYKEGINVNNGQSSCDNNKYVSFKGFANTSIADVATLATTAHSGKKVLQINANNSITKTVRVAGDNPNDYDLSMQTGPAGGLYDVGGDFIPLYVPVPFSFPVQWQINTAFPAEEKKSVDFSSSCIAPVMSSAYNPFTASNLGASNYAYYDVPGNPPLASCFPNGNWSMPGASIQYIEVTQKGNYVFTVGQEDGFLSTSGGPSHQPYFYEKLIISQVSNDLIVDQITGPTYLDQSAAGGIKKAVNTKSVALCPGIYKLSFLVYQNRCFGDLCLHTYRNYYVCDQNLTSYKSLATQSGCSYNKPIAATQSMLNSTFVLKTGKKMQISVWVREKCDSVVCYKPTYVNNHIELQFPGSGVDNFSFAATGTIIEGWQKIEGVFTVPANATTANLVLSNDGSQPVYFDDIRIHPFNANMKSYVYDPRTLRLSAELDENNYASFYEYDEEGQLIRVKKETIQGIKTITETRNAKQRGITNLQ